MCIMLLKSNANNLQEKEKMFMSFQFYTIRIGNQFLKNYCIFKKKMLCNNYIDISCSELYSWEKVISFSQNLWEISHSQRQIEVLSITKMHFCMRVFIQFYRFQWEFWETYRALNLLKSCQKVSNEWIMQKKGNDQEPILSNTTSSPKH